MARGNQRRMVVFVHPVRHGTSTASSTPHAEASCRWRYANRYLGNAGEVGGGAEEKIPRKCHDGGIRGVQIAPRQPPLCPLPLPFPLPSARSGSGRGQRAAGAGQRAWIFDRSCVNVHVRIWDELHPNQGRVGPGQHRRLAMIARSASRVGGAERRSKGGPHAFRNRL